MKPSLYKVGDLIEVMIPKRDTTLGKVYEVIKKDFVVVGTDKRWVYCIKDDVSDAHWLREDQIKRGLLPSPCDAGAEEYEEIMRLSDVT